MINKRCLLLVGLFVVQIASAQQAKSYLLWSETRKLTVDDFIIKTERLASTPSFAQFAVDYAVGGFSFFTKNFNKKVRNYFMPAASWIDTTTNVASSIRYQQTLFDISEVYTRQFRRALRENRKQFLKGTHLAAELNKEMIAAFAERRIAYDRDTKFGVDEARQKEWEVKIESELQTLGDYAYDK